jgi:IclR family transcriptional regulator, acetate operon repressor
MRGTPSYAGTKSIHRAARLLGAFSDARPELSLAELARVAGANKATAYRALVALESEGLVQRTAETRYRLGPTLITLGHLATRTSDLRTLGRPELETLAIETGETATLEIAVEGAVMILDEVQATGLVGVRAAIGTRWPLHATSTGKALLAAAATAAEGGVATAGLEMPATLPALTSHTLTTSETLRAAFDRIRADGYAVAFEELQRGYVAVGAAIADHEGRPVAAIGVGGPPDRLPHERLPALGATVRAAAARLSAKLGAPGGSYPP